LQFYGLQEAATEIKVRQDSRETLKTYAQWAGKFQRFMNNKPQQDLTTSEVKQYLDVLI